MMIIIVKGETESPMGTDELNYLGEGETVLHAQIVEIEEDEDEYDDELDIKSMNF